MVSIDESLTPYLVYFFPISTKRFKDVFEIFTTFKQRLKDKTSCAHMVALPKFRDTSNSYYYQLIKRKIYVHVRILIVVTLAIKA